jgi:hypothetical protein
MRSYLACFTYPISRYRCLTTPRARRDGDAYTKTFRPDHAGCAPLSSSPPPQVRAPLPIPTAQLSCISPHSPIPGKHANLPGLLILAPSSNQIKSKVLPSPAIHSTNFYIRPSLRRLRLPSPSPSTPSVPSASCGLQIILPKAFIARPSTTSVPASPHTHALAPRTPSPTPPFVTSMLQISVSML